MLKKGPKVVEFIVLLDHSFTILLPSNFSHNIKSKMKMFFTDSQPRCVLKLLKFWLISAWTPFRTVNLVVALHLGFA